MDSALWRMAARNAGMWYFCREPGWRRCSTGLLHSGVKAVLTGTAAGEVLHGHGNTLGGNAVAAALDAGDQVVEDLLNELRVLAKGAEGALPTGSVTQSAMYM